MKICSKCGQSKESSDFFRSKYKRCGLSSSCKSCASLFRRKIPPTLECKVCLKSFESINGRTVCDDICQRILKQWSSKSLRAKQGARCGIADSFHEFTTLLSFDDENHHWGWGTHPIAVKYLNLRRAKSKYTERYTKLRKGLGFHTKNCAVCFAEFFGKDHKTCSPECSKIFIRYLNRPFLCLKSEVSRLRASDEMNHWGSLYAGIRNIKRRSTEQHRNKIRERSRLQRSSDYYKSWNKEYQRKYYELNKERIKAHNRTAYMNLSPEVRLRRVIARAKWASFNRERIRSSERRYKLKLKAIMAGVRKLRRLIQIQSVSSTLINKQQKAS